MAVAAARRRLWRGMRTAAATTASGEELYASLLSRLVAEPECRVKATMEEATSSVPHHDGAFWEPLAAALLRASYPAKAHLVSSSYPVLEWKLEKLLMEGVNSHNCEPYLTLIRFCGKTRNAALAMRVFECAEAQGIQLNTGIFNALINTFLSVGDLLAAVTLYETMEGIEDSKPDRATYDAFISAFSRLRSGDAMMSWYLAAKNAGFVPGIQAFESLIVGFVLLNKLDDAELVFEEMVSFEMKPTCTVEAKLEVLPRTEEVNRVNSFIKLVSDGNWELNKALVDRLTRLCLDGGEADVMEQLLALIQKEAHFSSVTQLHCGIIRFYASADLLSDMEHAIDRMLDDGMMFLCPEDVEAVICSYFRHKAFDRLEIFLNRIRSLYMLTRSSYDILVAGFRRFDLNQRLEATIKDMREAGFA
ncbi:hypothetical protein CFC21_058715 [Triticum aestivum]|uniref:PROP1-like PPR domain-containing protein n=2 Tax=Triticum aestivum TaxID=4565 RepID=A0A9R1GNV5_WHEAT|nr:hypothetical protein CFC21_058712 [Triticum aestivum]KAF7050329.1 hypothetical protein CFC21_058715 [Triticum aestivum]